MDCFCLYFLFEFRHCFLAFLCLLYSFGLRRLCECGSVYIFTYLFIFIVFIGKQNLSVSLNLASKYFCQFFDIDMDCAYMRNGIVRKCPVGELPLWEVSGCGIVWTGKWSLGNCPSGKGQSGICSWRNAILGTAQLSNCVHTFPGGIYLLKVNKRNTRTWCEICSELTIKALTPLASFWRLVVNSEHISHLVLLFLLLTLNM